MLRQILDLHIHSKYSRACSSHLVLPEIAKSCEVRGIDIVVTGDITHPEWSDHIHALIAEVSEGVYRLKDGSSRTKFLLGTEIALIKKHKEKTRRIHVCVFVPNLSVMDALNTRLHKQGFNLGSDGRPILGMTTRDFLELLLEVDPRIVMIPAHVWTPWFGLFGSKGGYDSLEEALDDMTPYVRAVETGLSSDPLMNWRVGFLDNITLVSNSDAHSPQKLGREANILQFDSESDITYTEIMRIINEGDREKFVSTIEFYPEEGKYHMDGHRDCNFVCGPIETKKRKGICPVCKKKLVVGVMNRIEELATRTEGEAKKLDRIPYHSVVPLPEIIADTFGCGVNTKKVHAAYSAVTKKLGSEFHILLHATRAEIIDVSGPEIAHAIERVREGKIFVEPGYDGKFGIVKVFQEKESRSKVVQQSMLLE